MMTTPDPESDRLPEWYDPFPEPRTLHSGWDLSDLLASTRAFGYGEWRDTPAPSAATSQGDTSSSA